MELHLTASDHVNCFILLDDIIAVAKLGASDDSTPANPADLTALRNVGNSRVDQLNEMQ